jgi:hypothetical protein
VHTEVTYGRIGVAAAGRAPHTARRAAYMSHGRGPTTSLLAFARGHSTWPPAHGASARFPLSSSSLALLPPADCSVSIHQMHAKCLASPAPIPYLPFLISNAIYIHACRWLNLATSIMHASLIIHQIRCYGDVAQSVPHIIITTTKLDM